MLFGSRESPNEIRSIFDDIGVKAKVTFSDDCASDILQLLNKRFFDFVVVATWVGHAGPNLPDEPRALGHKGASFNTAIKHDN